MQINWISFTYAVHDGYGRYGARMVRALSREGVEITPIAYETLKWDGWLQRLAGADYSRLTISLMASNMFKSVPGMQWGYSMYESTGLPDGWADNINKTCGLLLVPTEWMVDVFRSAGVKKAIPILVAQGGIDPEEFPVVDRRLTMNQRPFTFLALGDRAGRKGDYIAHTAFIRAFGENADPRKVRLVVKSRAENHANMCLVNNPTWYSLWRENIPNMADVFSQADCFVFPSHGEGYGMPPREAAATGMPVIATAAHGHVDRGLDNWAIPLVNNKLVKSPIGGEWWMPDIDEVADKMRYVYDHAEESFERGLRAAEWLRENETWRHAARHLVELIQQYG